MLLPGILASNMTNKSSEPVKTVCDNKWSNKKTSKSINGSIKNVFLTMKKRNKQVHWILPFWLKLTISYPG